MGNGVTRLGRCLCSCACASPPLRRRHHVLPSDAFPALPLDDSLGHSFCYVPSPFPLGPWPCDTDNTTTTNFSFRSICGAAVSANASTPLSTSHSHSHSHSHSTATTATTSSSFESSLSFASVPLFPSGPLSGPLPLPSDRPFMSSPIPQIQSYLSGPLNPPSTSASALRRSRSLVPTSTRRPRRPHISSLIRSLASSLSLTKHTLEQQPGEFPTITNTTPISTSVQWVQGRAGEDRVHVVVSEEHGWVFVGIYDGFNGPDATDFLLTHLYPFIQLQLKGILCQDQEQGEEEMKKQPPSNVKSKSTENGRKAGHLEVLKALSRALRKAEDAYLTIADNLLDENPELSLMGSCVLVMLMKGEDVYLMNVGDSRAVLASTSRSDLEGINEDLLNDFSGFLPTLSPVQLTSDHSTCAEEELIRIRNEHPDDPTAIANDRVKGSLKVTRAFGAGFLKQPRWNNALLEMFRIEYMGTAPYITCHPSLYHYRVGPKDKFLILSSDGLYQYLTNEEAVTQVEMLLSTSPDGDPAQHLIEELLFRAAAKAGMELHELLEIPQGDRRRYYDDVSIIVISLEGQIWRSSV